MISESHYKNLEHANRELALRFEKLKKARASRDSNGIKNAEMEYFQSLQHLYATVQDAVAERKPAPVIFSPVFCSVNPMHLLTNSIQIN